jgi:hypothetical protein
LIDFQELYYYIGIVVLLLIADIIVSILACTDQIKAGVVSESVLDQLTVIPTESHD